MALGDSLVSLWAKGDTFFGTILMLSGYFRHSKWLVVDSLLWVLMLPAHTSNWSGQVLPALCREGTWG